MAVFCFPESRLKSCYGASLSPFFTSPPFVFFLDLYTFYNFSNGTILLLNFELSLRIKFLRLCNNYILEKSTHPFPISSIFCSWIQLFSTTHFREGPILKHLTGALNSPTKYFIEATIYSISAQILAKFKGAGSNKIVTGLNSLFIGAYCRFIISDYNQTTLTFILGFIGVSAFLTFQLQHRVFYEFYPNCIL